MQKQQEWPTGLLDYLSKRKQRVDQRDPLQEATARPTWRTTSCPVFTISAAPVRFIVVTTFRVFINFSHDCDLLSQPPRALKTGEEKRYRHHFLSAHSYKGSPDILIHRLLVQFKVCLFGADIWTLWDTTNHHCLNERTQNWHVHAQTTETEVNRLNLHHFFLHKWKSSVHEM